MKRYLTHLSLWLACGYLLGAGGCDPELSLNTGGVVLGVGQRASIKVTEGGSGSDLLELTLRLTDASGRLYVPGGDNDLVVSRVKPSEVEFKVPVGVAPGAAQVELRTQEGPAFSGSLQIFRLATMRDLAGKLWVLALSGKGKLVQHLEVKQGDAAANLGRGFGKVSIAPGGVLLATSARAKGSTSARMVKLAWLGGDAVKVIEQGVEFSEQVEDVLATSTSQTLVATSAGTYVIQQPADLTAKPQVTKALPTGQTFALAAARKAARAVALGRTKNGATWDYNITLLSLGTEVKVVRTVPLAWQPDYGTPPVVAMSADGKTVLVADWKSSQLGLLREGKTVLESSNMPPGEQGPISIAAGKGSGTFYLLNRSSKPNVNLSAVTIASAGPKFGTPISVGLGASSGKPLAVVASDNDEVLVLAERDVVLVDALTSSASTIQFGNLFKDKKGGEVGGSLAIQP